MATETPLEGDIGAECLALLEATMARNLKFGLRVGEEAFFGEALIAQVRNGTPFGIGVIAMVQRQRERKAQLGEATEPDDPRLRAVFPGESAKSKTVTSSLRARFKTAFAFLLK